MTTPILPEMTPIQLRRWGVLAALPGEALRDLAERERLLMPLLNEDRFDEYVRRRNEAYGLPPASDEEYAVDVAQLAAEAARERELLALSPFEQVKARGCDDPEPPVYQYEDGVYRCRCMVCGRCGHHTGNTSQGHYWRLCKVTGTMREFHFCCPETCELEAATAEASR